MGLLKSTPAVGLEFDTGAIRAVQLRGTARSASIEAIAKVSIPEEAVIEGVIIDTERVAVAWRTFGVHIRSKVAK
ncbi:hypothetical protein N752_13320 [Desulforamulus aquiferis]|nr:hypothetical protein [Desulforamulus aquiferis]RYD04348.1 hypothetical protein N752_13320 [Desulforamulus aquiferis]